MATPSKNHQLGGRVADSMNNEPEFRESYSKTTSIPTTISNSESTIIPHPSDISKTPPPGIQPHDLLKKLDRRLMPLLGMCYLFAYLDRTNIANARVSNASEGDSLEQSLGLTDFQIQLSISVFFFGMS